MAESRVTQAAVEVLRDGPSVARITEAAVEVLRDGPAAARVTEAAVEVLRDIPLPQIRGGQTGQLQNSSGASIGSGTMGTITAAAGELVCILFATNRTDTVYHMNRVTAVTATGLTFTEVFDEELFADVGGAFPKSTFHLQLWVAPAASAVSALAWSSTMSDGFTNVQSAVLFRVSGLNDITAAFDGNVSASLAASFAASDVSGSLGTPTVNMDTTNLNDLLLTAFIDIREDNEGTAPLTPSPGAGYSELARVSSNRSFAAGNLYVQYKNVDAQQTTAAQAGAWSTKNWIAVAIAFTKDAVPISSDFPSSSDSDYIPWEIKTNTLTIDAGSGNVTIPTWVSFLKVELWGPGGGSPGYAVDWLDLPSHVVGTITGGSDGGNSSISTLSMVANGGDGAGEVLFFNNHPITLPQISYGGTLGALGGTASGGDVNTTGENGTTPFLQLTPGGGRTYIYMMGNGFVSYPDFEGMPGKGGGMVNHLYTGLAQIPTAAPITAQAGIAPGRGANGELKFGYAGGFGTSGGGQGGYSMKEWAEGDSDAPDAGDVWAYVIGAAGAGGTPTTGNAARIYGAAGAAGRLRLTYGTYYSEESASDSDAESFHSDGFESDVPESDASDSEVDLFPGVPRTPASPYADFDSMWSQGERYGAGLITASDVVGETSGGGMASAFNGNYGHGAGDGPSIVYPTVTGPDQVYMHFTTNQGVKLRGLRFVNGDDGKDFRAWSLWAGFSHGGPMIPIADSFSFICNSNGAETELFVFGIVPEDYDLDFTYFELRKDSGTSQGGRCATEIELMVAHSPLDGGDRTGDVVGHGSKRIHVTSDISLDVPNSLYDGTWKGIIAGKHYYTNRSGAMGVSQRVHTVGSFGAGKKIEFTFPREVAMREMVLESSTAEVYSAGVQTKFGTWQWSGSNDGTTWTNVGGVLQFAEGSTMNVLPSPQTADSSDASDGELIHYRRWRMTSVAGFSTGFALWGVTFNLADPIFGHSPSDIDGGSGDSDESDFGSDGDISDSVDSSADSSAGSSADSSAGGGSDSSGGGSSSSDAPSSDSVEPPSEHSFESDSFGDHDPVTLPIVQAGVVAIY